MGRKDRREFLKDMTFCGLTLPLLSTKKASGAWNAATAQARQTIDLGDSYWYFTKSDPYPEASKPAFNDATWEKIGVPHCFNDLDTYQNVSQNKAFRGTVWYRKHFTIDAKDKGKNIFLEFQSVDVGAAIYVNGRFKPGNTSVRQPQDVTHVGCFIPFALDITEDIRYGEENVLAVRVSNAENSFFTWPDFGAFLGLGMGFGGIVSPVYVHITHAVHIPLNVYSPLGKWGTYMSTLSATDDQATIRTQVNVENNTDSSQPVTVSNTVFDADGKTVLALHASHTIAPRSISLFDQTGEITNPHLWYPNNSKFGRPYLYRIVSTVELDNREVDAVESSLGIRTFAWDDDYGYINGKRHLLNGFGQRNTYPALGAAVPAALQWNDIKLIADCGGRALRVGHLPATVETVAACDAYGVLVIQDSGDDEWALHGEPALTYKKEYDRDTIIQFRNNPSLAVWESNNGIASVKKAPDFYSPRCTQELVDRWDPVGGRIVESRDTSDYWPKDKKIMIGYTANYKKVAGSPSINLECYYRGNARFDYSHEKESVAFFTKQYLSNIQNSACGWIFWMLAETMESPFMPYLNGMTSQKSLGSCAMDGNRFPKLPYRVFQNAIWASFPARPGVALQSSWNLSGIQDVDAWSNCPLVELFINSVSKGIRTPDAEMRCTWLALPWESGTLKAVGLDHSGKPVCSDERRTSGAARRIILTVEPPPRRPDGGQFRLRANGSDVALVTAKIVDQDGLWCPTADNNLRFSVSGPGNYRGSYNFYVVPGKPITYHSPGDTELQAEGGLMRVAIRSTFEAGTVHVTATANGLETGHAAFRIVTPAKARLLSHLHS
ncbi:MAG: glycoside hydrolase family 2 protein [Acidobacteriaceae bacterium]